MVEISDLPINLLDAGIIVIMLLSAIFAYTRGFVHEIFSIAGWIGAAAATFYGFPYMQPQARQLIGLEILADLAVGTLIFVFALVFLSMLTQSIASRIKDSALNALDRSLGFLFGLLRGALIVVIAYIGFEILVAKINQPEWVKTARSIQLIEPAADLLISHLPKEYAIKRRNAATDAISLKQKSSELIDTGKVVRDLIAPAPKARANKQNNGYNQKERQVMERLIGNTQKQ